MITRKILTGDVATAAGYLSFAARLFKVAERTGVKKLTRNLSNGIEITVTTGRRERSIHIHAGGIDLLFTVNLSIAAHLYAWAARSSSRKVALLDDNLIAGINATTRRLTRFFQGAVLYLLAPGATTPTWSLAGMQKLTVRRGRLLRKEIGLASFAEEETEREYDFIHSLPDGKQFVYCGPYDFSKAGNDGFWYERDLSGDGLFRETFALPLTAKNSLPGDLYWPARGWDSRGFSVVTTTSLYIRGAYSDEKSFPGDGGTYYEVWRRPHLSGVLALVAVWFGARTGGENYSFHSFLVDHSGTEGGYVDSLYTIDGVPPIEGDRADFYVGKEADDWGSSGLLFSIDFGVLLDYVRVENSRERFVNFWRIREGVYGIHLRNYVNYVADGDIVHDAFLLWVSAETALDEGIAAGVSVVYKVPSNRATSLVYGGSEVNPYRPQLVFFAECDRLGLYDSGDPENCVSYALDMNSTKKTVVASGVVPSSAAWAR